MTKCLNYTKLFFISKNNADIINYNKKENLIFKNTNIQTFVKCSHKNNTQEFPMLQIEKSNRRNTILATILIPVLQIIPNANATTEIPEGIFNNLYNNFKHLLGYKLQNDILDNYSFFVKDDWTRISVLIKY